VGVAGDVSLPVSSHPLPTKNEETWPEEAPLPRQHAKKLEDCPRILHQSPRCKVSHLNFSNPHTYTVRSMSQKMQKRVACKCESVLHWDSHTGEAEILCTCEGGHSNFTSEYFGEYNDSQRVYMKQDLQIPGSQHKKTKLSQF